MATQPQFTGQEYTDTGLLKYGDRDPITGQRPEQFIPKSSPFYVAPPKSVDDTPKPVGIVDSSPAEQDTTENINKFQSFKDQTTLGENFEVPEYDTTDLTTGKVTKGKKGKKPEDTTSTTPTEQDKTPEETQAEADIAKIDTQFNDAIDELDQIRVDLKSATQGLIDSIKQRYAERRRQMEDINKRQTESLKAIGYSLGTQRYTPFTATNIVSTSERQGLDRIKELDAEELSLISEAQIAMSSKDYEILGTKISAIEKLRTEKASQLKEIQKLSLERNKEVAEEKQKLERQNLVSQALKAGITDPLEIATSAGVPFEEVVEIFDGILKMQKTTEETALSAYTDIDGNRIQPFYNKNTGEYREIKLGKEKEDEMSLPASYKEFQLGQQDPAYAKFLDKNKAGGLSGELNSKQMAVAIQLSNSLKSHPMYMDILDVATGLEGVRVGLSAKNGFGDITAINAFQRMVDPGATVRSEDVVLLQQGSGLIDKILSDYPIEKLKAGDKLPQAVRERMMKVAKELYQARTKTYNESVGNQYKKLAEGAGIPFDYIGSDFSEGYIEEAGQNTLKDQVSQQGYDYEAMKADGLSDDDIKQALGL